MYASDVEEIYKNEEYCKKLIDLRMQCRKLMSDYDDMMEEIAADPSISREEKEYLLSIRSDYIWEADFQLSQIRREIGDRGLSELDEYLK